MGRAGRGRAPVSRALAFTTATTPAWKRVMGNKSQAQMSLAELQAAIGWMERNRLSEQLHLLDGDPRYAWSARKR
jgi:hypothetical protein